MEFLVSPEQREQKKLTADCLELFQYAKDYRDQWDTKAIEWYKLFRGKKPEVNEEEGRANLHIPKTYEAIDTIRSRLVKAFFGARPYIDFMPLPIYGSRDQMEKAEKRAEVSSALVDEQLAKNNIVSIYYDYTTGYLVFPAGIMSVGWRYEKKLMRKPIPVPTIVQTPQGPMVQIQNQHQESINTVWDDNEINNVDFFDFWVDPRGTNLDTARFVFHREWLTEQQLIHRLRWLSQLPEGKIFEPDFKKLRNAGSALRQGSWERQSEVGIHPEERDIMGRKREDDDTSKTLYEVLNYWEDDRRQLLVNRAEVLWDGPSPYWRHMKKPFVMESFDPIPNELYGFSAVSIIEDLQKELNTQHNQRLDNVSFILNKMWKVRAGSDVDESQLVSRAGGVIYLNDMGDVEELRTTDVASSAYAETGQTERQLENSLAVPPVIRGVEGGKTETATEASLKSSNASIRYDVRILLFENQGMKRLAHLMDMNNQQFINQSRVIRCGPEESMVWRQITPGDLIGEYDYRPAGTSVDPAANKEIRRQQMSQMLGFLIETGNPYVDIYELTKSWLESFDMRNVQKFLIPREVIEQQQQMQEMAEMALMGPQMGDPHQPETPQQGHPQQIGPGASVAPGGRAHPARVVPGPGGGPYV